MFSIQTRGQNDEILQYQEARFVSSMEAAMRIMGFPMYEHFPPVTQLAVHLESGQRIYFDENNARSRAVNEPPKTTLTAFFRTMQSRQFC